MGTLTDSVIRTARKTHACSRHDCPRIIERGSQYLAYKPGQRVTDAYCMGCATTIEHFRKLPAVIEWMAAKGVK